MERAQLLKLIKRRACSFIRSISTMTAVEYRQLNSMVDKKAVDEGVKIIMQKIVDRL